MAKRIAAILLSFWLICLSAAAHAAAPKGKDQSFEDFPEALDGEDDDLPF